MPAAALTGKFATLADGLSATTRLNQDILMPWFGLGVYMIPDDTAGVDVIRTALSLGYRHFDTASIYGNEQAVGRALRESGVPREEIFVTTKVWNDDIRADRIKQSCAESLQRLGLETIDLYLLHWPIKGRHGAAWLAMEELKESGKVRAIGVSNYMIPHLEELLNRANVVPAVNQIEFHPYLQSRPLLEFCQARDIRITAWGPLMKAGTLFRDPVLTGIADRLGRTVAQVVLRWELQSGVITIPKTVRAERMAENAAFHDFELGGPDMAAIDRLNRSQRVGPDPFNFGF